MLQMNVTFGDALIRVATNDQDFAGRANEPWERPLSTNEEETMRVVVSGLDGNSVTLKIGDDEQELWDGSTVDLSIAVLRAHKIAFTPTNGRRSNSLPPGQSGGKNIGTMNIQPPT